MQELILNDNKELNLQETFDRKLNSILGSSKFPVEIKQKLDIVLQDVNANKNIVDLYSDILSEIPISSSHFQDQCVQFEEHFTPHRKLRQCMLQLQDRLDSLDAAKNSFLKNVLRIKQLKEDIDYIKKHIDNIESGNLVIDNFYEMSEYIDSTSFNEMMFRYFEKNNFTPGSLRDKVKRKLENVLFEKSIELQEAERSLTSTEHLVKDASLKVVHHKNLIEKYQKEVEESGMCFEVSEMIYYVMYFTTEIEKQLRTMGRPDTGTFGVLRFLPDGIRKKVLSNMEYIKTKLGTMKDSDDFISVVNKDVLLPKIEGDCVEGVHYKEFTNIENINILSKKGGKEND